MGTHNLKVALISSALRSLSNITADQQLERLDSKAYQTKWFIQLIAATVCASSQRPKYTFCILLYILLSRDPSSWKQQFEAIFVFHFRLI